jgi:hypothetical protein
VAERQALEINAHLKAVGKSLSENAIRPVIANMTPSYVQYAIGPVNSAFAALGNASRAAGNWLANGVEYVTSGYGGTVGNAVAGLGGGAAQLLRTAGNIGAVVDVPRTFEAALDDVRQTVRTGQQYGLRTAAARQIGLLQGAEAYYGTDVLTGQEVSAVGKLSEAFGRLGGGAAAGAGAEIISRVAQQQADKGLPHLGRFLSAAQQEEFVRSSSLGAKILGQAVHQSTERALRDAYGDRFKYRQTGPDFLDTYTGRYVELTTPGQVQRHVAKGGTYVDAGYATYVLPKKP